MCNTYQHIFFLNKITDANGICFYVCNYFIKLHFIYIIKNYLTAARNFYLYFLFLIRQKKK